MKLSGILVLVLSCIWQASTGVRGIVQGGAQLPIPLPPSIPPQMSGEKLISFIDLAIKIYKDQLLKQIQKCSCNALTQKYIKSLSIGSEKGWGFQKETQYDFLVFRDKDSDVDSRYAMSKEIYQDL